MSAPAEWSCRPAVSALPPRLRAPPPVPRRSSPEPPLSPPSTPAAGMPRGRVSTPLCMGSALSHPRPTQMNRPAQAAAAAHTFFVANPGHQEMRQNLEYYQAMVGVHEDDFTDLEAKPHLVRTSPPEVTVRCATPGNHTTAASSESS